MTDGGKKYETFLRGRVIALSMVVLLMVVIGLVSAGFSYPDYVGPQTCAISIDLQDRSDFSDHLDATCKPEDLQNRSNGDKICNARRACPETALGDAEGKRSAAQYRIQGAVHGRPPSHHHIVPM